MSSTNTEQPATELAGVDVPTIRWIADTLSAALTEEARRAGYALREALAEPVEREWGVRHTTDLVSTFDSEHDARQSLNWGIPNSCAKIGCTLVSRTPGGVWEPVEQEEAVPDRFSVAEIEAAWETAVIKQCGVLLSPSALLTKMELLTALRAGREES